MGRRAPKFHGFVGHRKLLAPIRRELDGAKARAEPMPHMMLTGPSGVGKTELTKALTKESEKRLVRVMGYARRDVLLKKLHALQQGDFLFIDEAHGLASDLQDLLLEVIDRRRAPYPGKAKQKGRAGGAGKGPAKDAKVKKKRLPPFTLVLATDRPSHLENALQKRIPTRLHLTPYPLNEMKEIVELIAAKERVLLSPQAARRVAVASFGLPRRAKHLLVKLRLFARAERPQIGVPDVAEFLRAHGIDRDGLGPKERKYLRFLQKAGKASLTTLAQFLGTDDEDVRLQVEPPLFRKGLIDISSSGRRLTDRGRKRAAMMKRRRQAPVTTSEEEEQP
jgi:Holliday junction DNA helicase RuvB